MVMSHFVLLLVGFVMSDFVTIDIKDKIKVIIRILKEKKLKWKIIIKVLP